MPQDLEGLGQEARRQDVCDKGTLTIVFLPRSLV